MEYGKTTQKRHGILTKCNEKNEMEGLTGKARGKRNVLITGGSGLVGVHLCNRLKEKNYAVSILSRERRQIPGIQTYLWEPVKGEIEEEAFNKTDCIIHLAGTNIGEKRWSNKRKQSILDSRIRTCQLIFEKVKKLNQLPEAFISVSAIGYYGAVTSEKIFAETDPPANDFLGTVCKEWEAAADKFSELGIRTVKIRTGMVLAKEGGVLPKMLFPVKIGIGSPLGGGNQYMPWLHIDDLCRIYIKAMEDVEFKGVYNAVAPDFETNKEFMLALTMACNKLFWFPNVPSFVLKLIFGEMSDILLSGSRVSPEKIISAGYNFQFPKLENALKDLLK